MGQDAHVIHAHPTQGDVAAEDGPQSSSLQQQADGVWVDGRLPPALGYASGALRALQGRLAAVGSVVEAETREEAAALRARLAAVVLNTAPPEFQQWVGGCVRGTWDWWVGACVEHGIGIV